MHIWASEGYASLDFAKRQVTFVQPSPELRQHGLDPARLDPALIDRVPGWANKAVRIEPLSGEDEERLEKQRLRQMAENNPVVQQMLKTFRGEIVDVRRTDSER